MMLTAQALIAIARGMLGVRFLHQGRHAKEGLDCLGFLLAVADRAGITFDAQSPYAYDRSDYGARPDTVMLRQSLVAILTPADTMQLADILLLRVDGRAQHLAMVTDYPGTDDFGMIHAYAPARKVVEHRLDAQWQSAIAGIYRLPVFH